MIDKYIDFRFFLRRSILITAIGECERTGSFTATCQNIKKIVTKLAGL
ncbi:hypothetical protein [Neobacillus sp. 204]